MLNDVLAVASMSASGKPAIVAMLQAWRLTMPSVGKNAGDANGALLKAAHQGDSAGAQAALTCGAEVSARDSRGMDSMSWAALRVHAEVIAMLLDHGASPVATNGSGWPPLGQASGQGHVAVVKLLLAHGADANQTFSGGRTALMCAAQQGHAEVVTALLGGAADAAATINGQTAFDLAVMQDHAAVAALLAPRP